MNTFHYESDLNGGSLMVRESRIIADLLLKNVPKEVWDDAIFKQNALQKRSQATARRYAQAIRKRLELLNPELLVALRDGDEELATQAALCGALERNLLLVEFMESTLRDAYTQHHEKLEVYSWSDFIEERSAKDSRIEDWKENTKIKMGQVVFRILIEAGYIQSKRSMKLQRVIIRPEIRVLLEDSYRHRIKNCLEIASRQ